MTSNSTSPKRVKAYSYVRFSTPEQARGDSARRQVESAVSYADANLLDLDEELTFEDHGVSAFHGRNARTGSLKRFLRAVDDGDVAEGSYLLVESFDRLSRADIWSAMGLLTQIMEAGILLVTLADQRLYSKDSISKNPMELMMSIVIMTRAHEESATKSVRLKAAYDRKRQSIRSAEVQSKPFTRRLPAWITWDETDSCFALIPDHAEVIASIFRLADGGMGKKAISDRLNTSAVKPLGVAEYWHASYIGKLLVFPACVGTFTPHIRQTVDGRTVRVPQDPVLNYWPAAIPQDVYERVSARFNTSAARGVHSNKSATSVVAGVSRCGLCGSAFIRVSKPPHTYLVCSRAHAKAGCEYLAVRYADVETSLVTHMNTLIDSAPTGQGTEMLEANIQGMEAEVSDIQDELDTFLDDYRRTKSTASRQRIAKQEIALESIMKKLAALRAEKQATSSPHVTRRLETLRAACDLRPVDVPAVNRALRECVKRLEIDPRQGRISLQWHHSSFEQESFPFESRHIRGSFPKEPEAVTKP